MLAIGRERLVVFVERLWGPQRLERQLEQKESGACFNQERGSCAFELQLQCCCCFAAPAPLLAGAPAQQCNGAPAGWPLNYASGRNLLRAEVPLTGRLVAWPPGRPAARLTGWPLGSRLICWALNWRPANGALCSRPPADVRPELAGAKGAAGGANWRWPGQSFRRRRPSLRAKSKSSLRASSQTAARRRAQQTRRARSLWAPCDWFGIKYSAGCQGVQSARRCRQLN